MLYHIIIITTTKEGPGSLLSRQGPRRQDKWQINQDLYLRSYIIYRKYICPSRMGQTSTKEPRHGCCSAPCPCPDHSIGEAEISHWDGSSREPLHLREKHIITGIVSLEDLSDIVHALSFRCRRSPLPAFHVRLASLPHT